MSKTKTLSTNQKFEFITEEIHEYFRGGYKYDWLPEKLKATLDKQAMELYDLQALCYKSFEKIVQKLQSIIYEQHPVYASVDYFWMEEETGWDGCNEFITLVFETFRLCGNINDKQDLSKIYAHLGLWDTASIAPRLQEPILKTLRK